MEKPKDSADTAGRRFARTPGSAEYYCDKHKYNPPANSGFCLCPKCEMEPWPSENDLVPVEQWSVKTKTARALSSAQCPCCGARPESLDPLPPGWCWDTMEPVNSAVWCPKWTSEIAAIYSPNTPGERPGANKKG